MQRSTDRILTTHVGSLIRPQALQEFLRAKQSGKGYDEAAYQQCLTESVAAIVKQQADVGIDVVSDGEFGKSISWSQYVLERLGGFERRPFTGGSNTFARGADRTKFAEFYAELDSHEKVATTMDSVVTGPITYIGAKELQRDIDNFKAALAATRPADAFMSSVFTGVQFGSSEYYRSNEEQAVACAEAMRQEYRAIVDAGLNVQIDDPILVNVYEFRYSDKRDVAGFRKWADEHVALVNHALEGIPEERVRYHLCWGSWHGPHSADLPLHDVIDLLVKVKASQYSFEAANPQHEHEWKVWNEVKLPPGRALIPGVVTHATDVVEHPELVSQRLQRYARLVGRENVIAGTDCGFAQGPLRRRAVLSALPLRKRIRDSDCPACACSRCPRRCATLTGTRSRSAACSSRRMSSGIPRRAECCPRPCRSTAAPPRSCPRMGY